MLFNHGNLDRTEFAVALRSGEEPYYLIPVHVNVQVLLHGMLTQTLSKITKAEQIEDIEYGEEYGNDVCLRCAIDDPTVQALVELFNRDGIPSRATALNDPSLIDFYFARYIDENGNRCMGIKTPSQFKATIGKKLIQLLGDELVVVQDRLFKLDNEFDFLVYADQVIIINPKQFMRVAEVDRVLAQITPQHVGSIAAAMPVVDFAPLSTYITNHSRAQKLVSSIRKRGNLAQITLPMLQAACAQNEIQMREQDGKLIIEPGHEIAFLELLDGRRYVYPFDETTPELLRALRRTKVTV